MSELRRRSLIVGGVAAAGALAIAGQAGASAGSATSTAGSAPRKTATGQDRPELREAIQAFVDSGFTGVQLRVHDERGEWVGSAGVRKRGEDAKPPTNGLFRIGSNTKTFVATMMLQLVAEGRIGLDAPAADYLPGFGLDRRITVRMLLQHTSGVFNFTGEYFPDGVVPGIPALGKEWVDNRFHTYRPQELVRLALSKQPRFDPGTAWNYSNTNYVLAALLIEKVCGRSYAEEMQRRILRPLGLRDTVVPGTSTKIPGPHAHGYYRYYEDSGEERIVDVTRQNPSWISAAGEMISTTRDLHIFISALMTGKLLPAALLAEMRKPHPLLGYGLGLFVQDGSTASPFPMPSCGATVVNHNGNVQGYGALMYSTPDGRRTMTGSLTYVDDAPSSVGEAFRQGLQRLVNEVFCGG